MKHAILGAGAIGGLVGAALASLGEDVTVVVRPERLPGYPAELSVERPSGTITAPAKAAAKLTDPLDVVWIATKTYQLTTALEAVQASPRWIVPLLNGVDHVEVLRGHFGRDRVVPGTIAVEAEKIARGRDGRPATSRCHKPGQYGGRRSDLDRCGRRRSGDRTAGA